MTPAPYDDEAPSARRVAVTGPARRTGRPRQTRRAQIDEETAIGEVYLGSLLREQLRLAAAVVLVLALGLGSLPLVFWLAPDLTTVHVLGIPLPWLVLGMLAHPFLLLVGWFYVRAAESNEDDFTDLVESAEGS